MVKRVDLGNDPGIPRLMEFLKTAFRPGHFDEVEGILMARENKLKDKVDRLMGENEGLKLDKVNAEAELNELKMLITVVDRDRKDIKERMRQLLEGDDFVKGHITELRAKVVKLENEKSKAEDSGGIWKRRYEDLEARISQLEKNALLLELAVPVSENMNEGLRANCTVHEKGNPDFTSVKIEPDVIECNENTGQIGAPTCHSPEAQNHNSTDAVSKGPAHCIFIDIDSDDDDEDCNLESILPENHMTSGKSPQISHSIQDGRKSESNKLKRKLDAETENSYTNDNTQSSKHTCLRETRCSEEQMEVERTFQSPRRKFVYNIVRRDNEDSDTDSISSDSDSDQFVTKLSHVKYSRKWNDEVEMSLALRRDPELCMDAVCALYRQQFLPKSLTFSKHRGFVESDVVRGTQLAEFLTDGDQEGKRRKSKEELIEHDKNGIEDCRNMVSSTRYSKQLFEMYKNQEDPLFP